MFVDGEHFEETFETDKGAGSVFAEVHVAEFHLILYEVLFFPANGEEFLEVGFS